MGLEQGARWLQATGRLPSVVAGVVAGGRLAEFIGLGVGSGGVAPTSDTQYRIGSITKTLVAVLVLQARDAGLLDLDDPIGRLVPETGYATVSLAQLLSHTGGLQSEPVGPWWERHAGGPVDALLAANDGTRAVAAPGAYFHYSNLGFALVGEAVVRLHGAPWWDVVSARLLDPLGMARTTYHPAAPHAQGHSVRHLTGVLCDEPHHDTGAMAPAGQAWSTADDLARWAGFLAAGHPGVLSRDTLVEMGTDRRAPSYGLGLRRVTLDGSGTTLVGHTGSMPGFVASLFVDQSTGRGTVLLANATTGIVTDEVPSVLLGSGGGPPSPPPASWTPTRVVPEAVLPLLGTWFWGNTAVELRWQDDTLQLRNAASGRLSDVFAQGDDGRLVGVSGYHRGETLVQDGEALECATFRYTREPTS